MQRFLDLTGSWPYLPQFRVVAEFESLSRAARKMGVSSAALSKAIRALERALGVELFDRTGGTLRLTDHGRALLGAVRNAMRDLDDAIAAARGGTPAGLVRIGVDAAWAALVIAPDPATQIELAEPPAIVHRALLRGEVDLVFHVEPIAHSELDSVVFARLQRCVCVAPDHAERAAQLPFVAIRPDDGWPSGLPRRVAMTTSSLAHALAATASGLATVAPIELARRFGLVAIPSEAALAPVTLWATIRAARGQTSGTAARWRALASRRFAG